MNLRDRAWQVPLRLTAGAYISAASSRPARLQPGSPPQPWRKR
jgi:hypothetical protein